MFLIIIKKIAPLIRTANNGTLEKYGVWGSAKLTHTPYLSRFTHQILKSTGERYGDLQKKVKKYGENFGTGMAQT